MEADDLSTWLTAASAMYRLCTTLLVVAASSIILMFLRRRYSISAPSQVVPLQEAVDSGDIIRCPNPGCIRCRRYAEVNQQAQRKLAWILKTTTENAAKQQQQQQDEQHPLQRVVDGVQQNYQTRTSGSKPHRQQSHHGEKRPSGNESFYAPRVPDQYPMVLLVPGLITSPNPERLGKLFHSTAIQWLQKHVVVIRRECEELLVLEQGLHNSVGGSSGNISTATLQATTENANDTRNVWLENNVSAKATAPWKVWHLMNQGVWRSHDQKAGGPCHAPETRKIVEQLPLLNRCIFGNVFFSHVQEGSDIPFHCGPSNVRHRLHLTLLLEEDQPPSPMNRHRGGTEYNHYRQPPQRPRLWVTHAHQVHWRKSQAFVFDDSIRHAVEYYCDDENDLVRSGCQPTKGITGTHQQDNTGCEDIRMKEGDGCKNTNNNGSDDEIGHSPKSSRSGRRVVLIVDVWHPDLTEMEREAIRDLYPAAAK